MSAIQLLSRKRAAEHVIHAIAEGCEDLITARIMATLGPRTNLERSADLPASWDFGGHTFVMSGAAAALGAAAIITAPLEVPTLLVGGFAFAASHVTSFLGGAQDEVSRVLAAEEFRRTYGIRRDQLRWSVVPAATLFWYLDEGDGVLELALKAKSGSLGLDKVDPARMERVVRRLLEVMPGTAAERAARLSAAIAKSERDMGVPTGDRSLEPARLLAASMGTLASLVGVQMKSEGESPAAWPDKDICAVRVLSCSNRIARCANQAPCRLASTTFIILTMHTPGTGMPRGASHARNRPMWPPLPLRWMQQSRKPQSNLSDLPSSSKRCTACLRPLVSKVTKHDGAGWRAS